MAAKKARKRAYIPPSSEVVNRRERTHTTRTHKSTSRAPGKGQSRRDYAYPKPTLQRTLRRLPIYFVMIFALQYLLGTEGASGLTTTERLVRAGASAGFVTILFAPFMHLMDRFAYGRYLKRTGQAPASDGASGA